MTRDDSSAGRVALGLRGSETVRETVEWADQLLFCNLTGADLSEMNLGGKVFIGCILSGCSFHAATLDRARFRTCVASSRLAFDGASTIDVRVENCNFSVSDGTIHPAWEEFSNEILAVASGQDVELICDVRNPDYLEADDGHEAAVFFAAQALYADKEIMQFWVVQDFATVLARRPDVVGSALDSLVALTALRAGDPHVDQEAFKAVEIMQPSQRAIELLCSQIHCPDPTIRLEALRGVRGLFARFDWEDPLSNQDLFEALLQAEKEDDEQILEWTILLWYDRVWGVADHDSDTEPKLGNILTRLLRHPSSKVRIASLATLSRLAFWDGRDAIAPLLEDDEPEVRERAWKLLYHITNPGAKLRAFVLASPPSARGRDTIACDCAYFRELSQPSRFGAADELARLAASPDPEERRQGIYFIALAGDPGQHDVLLAGLSDRDPRVRREAIEAVAAAGIPDAITSIESLLTDSNEEVRAEATRAVERMRKTSPDGTPGP